ncbi:MAG TPA: hypothetical protein VIL69_00435, partial [Roseomonas sp.]
GFAVGRIAAVAPQAGAFHPIYALGSAGAAEALEALDPSGLDAVVLLGTGMPSLGTILARPRLGRAPVLSCMLALAWRACLAAERREPDPTGLLEWISGADWSPRYHARMG